MKKRKAAKATRFLKRLLFVVIVAAIAYWQRDTIQEVASHGEGSDRPRAIPVLKEGPIPGIDTPPSRPSDAATQPAPGGGEKSAHGYTKLTNARWLDREGNDGDSFWVQAGGREFELRLYFVDAPESYLSDRHENQRRRVRDQGEDLGGLAPEQVVKLGNQAKEFTKRQLDGKPFTIYTYWEEVYSSERFYGFVQLPDGEYLGTKLVKEGLARIHTKGPGSKEQPVPTPTGDSFHKHREMLKVLERQAQAAGKGAWGH